jgi:hypothetical protein
VPFAVAIGLVTVCVDAADKVTTKAAFVVPPVPSATATSAIDSVGVIVAAIEKPITESVVLALPARSLHRT